MQDALNSFLKDVQNRAFVTAKLATGNDDEAFDLVQDSMFKLVRNYADRQAGDWPKLFQTILQNAIKDWYRRNKVRRILYWWQQQDQSEDELEIAPDAVKQDSPQHNHQNLQLSQHIYRALKQLPERQRQAFVLRAWWQYSTEETAQIMACSQGSVKTHYSRATSALGNLLQHAVL